MDIFIQKLSDFINAKLLLIIEPYRGSNYLLQVILLVVLVIGTLFLNRFLAKIIKKNYNKIRKSSAGSLIYEVVFPVYSILNVALVLSFTAQVLEYMKIDVPIIDQLYVILYL